MSIQNEREERGKKIAEKPNQIKRIDENLYHVKSQTNDSWYDVIITESGYNCSCPDYQSRKVVCKHAHGVRYSLLLRNVVEKQTVNIEQLNMMSICPKCKSDNIVKHGLRHNKCGDLQRFSCKECKKRFSVNLGFEKMKFSANTITSALQLYFTGESLRNVTKFLRLQGVEVSHKTVYVWIKKYIGLMENYLEQITPQVSGTWRSDEIYLKIKGNTKYLYCLLDDQTRFLIAQQISDKKNTEDVRPLFRKGKEIVGKKPDILITDGAKNFSEAFIKEYYTVKKPQSQHIRHIHFRGDKNNNKMERFNGEIRDREKTMRGLKKMDTPILTGYQIYHNYLRPHMALEGKTPADLVGISIEGQNKWLTLIQNAKSKKVNS